MKLFIMTLILMISINNMILGHERQIKYLEKVLQNGRLAHAYLFSGPENVGKFTIAKAVAKFFYCPNYQGLGRTDECNQCRQIERNLHPSVVVLELEQTLVSKKDERKEIPIEDIRELKRKLVFAPVLNEWRVVIIGQADKMSKEAAAAFLKLLEEPGSRVLFILLSAFKDSISPTIISRTQVINFSLLSTGVLADFLKAKIKDPDFVREILLLARGRAGFMFKLLEDKKSLDEERKFLGDLGVLLKKDDLAGALHLSEKISGNDLLRQKAAAYLILAIRQRLFKDKTVLAKSAYSITQSLKKMQQVWQIMETTNVNPRLALDVMFLEVFHSYGS